MQPNSEKKEAVPTQTKENEEYEAQRSSIFLWFFLVMLVFSLYLLFQVFSPFFHSIVLASIFSTLFYPVYKWCLIVTKSRRIPSAMLVITFFAFFIIIPVIIFTVGLIPQATSSIKAINQWIGSQDLGDLISQYISPNLDMIRDKFPELGIDSFEVRERIKDLISTIGQNFLSFGTYFVRNTVTLCFHFLLILLIMFFLLLDGPRIVQQIEYLFPLKPQQTAVVMESLRKMSRSVFIGGMLVAVLQGIAGGIGFAIVDLPALFWGTVMVFAALIPVVGTGLVWIPAICFLLLNGQNTSALILALWCGIGVSSIDSFLRPFLLRDGAPVPVLFLFLAVLGGVKAFGMLGILYGPMILGLAAVMLSIYAEEYHHILSSRKH